jgi:hypothetical protein
MEKIYAKQKDNFSKVETSPETIQFLLSYSKSLNITEVNGHQFENNLN